MNSSSLIANAKTSGARFVCRIVFASSSSSALDSGSVRDSSIAAGVVTSSVDTVFLRLTGVSEETSPGSRALFLVTLLAALRSCFAIFGSANIPSITVMDDFASESEL